MTASAFADVDDLEENNDLELYVEQSVAINMFLSHGYFKSINCLREVQATLEKQKPFMLTHEADIAKGGRTVGEIKIELDDEKLRQAIFCDGRRLTVWYRLADFQLVSLKEIAEFTLLQTPKYKHREKLDLAVPGEELRKSLGFNEPVVIYASRHNPGAQALAAELAGRYKGVRVTETLPSNVQITSETSGRRSAVLTTTHFLLYLNLRTFHNDEGTRLAEELRSARTMGMPVVMAHENDPERGGCEYARFFQTTPADLLEDGLYKTLAIATLPGESHRAISMALIAKALGAVPQQGISMSKAVGRHVPIPLSSIHV